MFLEKSFLKFVTMPSQEASEARYRLTLKDWVQFALDMYDEMPSMRFIYILSHWGVCVAYMLVSVFIYFFYKEFLFSLSFLCLAISWFFLFPKLRARRVFNTLLKMKNISRKSPDASRSQVIELKWDEETLRVSADGESSVLLWSDIRGVVIKEDRFYLKLAELKGIIVPRTDHKFEEILKTCQSKISKQI